MKDVTKLDRAPKNSTVSVWNHSFLDLSVKSTKPKQWLCSLPNKGMHVFKVVPLTVNKICNSFCSFMKKIT